MWDIPGSSSADFYRASAQHVMHSVCDCHANPLVRVFVHPSHVVSKLLNPLYSKGNYSATSNNTKLLHLPLIGGLLHWDLAGPAQSPPRCTKCK